MMNDEIKRHLQSIFQSFSEVKLVYLFGSQARGETSLLSDYDFAVYFDTKDIKRTHAIKFDLQDKIGRVLKSDKVDVVVLNLTESPELKYNIIREGQIIFEQEPFKVLVEPRILSEYFDFHRELVRHGLTKA